MITFKQYITEVFNKPLKYKWEIKNSSEWGGDFTTDKGTEVMLDMDHSLGRGESYDYWEVQFEANDSFALTGRGESIAVFSTVFAMMKEWIKKEKPKMITFNAKEQNRQRLYTTFIKKFAGPLGYKLKDTASGPEGDLDFALVRK